MHLDLRYHAITLIAVFCALLIGIMVGALLVGDPTELQTMVAELKADNQRVREQHSQQFARLKADYDVLSTSAKQMQPALARGRLQYRRVALIFLHEDARRNLEKGLRVCLTSAGAMVTSSTVLLPSLFELDADTSRRIAERLQLIPPPWESFPSVLAGRLARRLAEGEHSLPTYLQSAGLVRFVPAGPFTPPVGAILVVGGLPQAYPDALDLVCKAMLAEWKAMGVTVLGCESAEARPSAIAAFQSWDISTVDNVDALPGQLALVLTIETSPKQPKHYGVKDTAEQLLPPLTGGGDSRSQ